MSKRHDAANTAKLLKRRAKKKLNRAQRAESDTVIDVPMLDTQSTPVEVAETATPQPAERTIFHATRSNVSAHGF